MFLLKLKGGLELTEAEVKVWDNVPTDIEIKKLALGLPTGNGKFIIFDLSGYQEYCCAKVGSGSLGGPTFVGYCLYGALNGQVTETMILQGGIKQMSYPREKCELPMHCWRKGIG